MKLVPDSFQIPEKLQTPEFIISKLCFSDIDLDYKTIMSNVDIIKKTRGGNWPTADFTLLEDQIDLGWHQKEFENRTSFAFKVMTLDESECLGCLYLYPPGFRNASSKDADVDVSFWVTQKAYDAGFYEKVYKILDTWLKTSWPFQKIVYTNKEIPN